MVYQNKKTTNHAKVIQIFKNINCISNKDVGDIPEKALMDFVRNPKTNFESIYCHQILPSKVSKIIHLLSGQLSCQKEGCHQCNILQAPISVSRQIVAAQFVMFQPA